MAGTVVQDTLVDVVQVIDIIVTVNVSVSEDTALHVDLVTTEETSDNVFETEEQLAVTIEL